MLLEVIEKVFARLNALGYAEVRARLDRGEHLGDPDLVREWLELNAPQRPQTPVASAINARQRR
jgi:hypothetical protein